MHGNPPQHLNATALWLVQSYIAPALAVTATLVLLLLLKLTSLAFTRLRNTLESWRGTKIRSLRFQQLELVESNRIADTLLLLLKALRAAFALALLYAYLLMVFSLFPATQNVAAALISYAIEPLMLLWHGVLAAMPGVFAILIVVVVTRYALRAIHFLFTAVEKGRVTLTGFYPEWAQQTYKLIRILVIAFALVVIYPYIPGSDSPAFKGVSVFFGLLFSLGSTSAVANVIAGVVLTYTRSFQLGDRVQVNETIGDVIEKTLLVTRIRTIKNVDVTIPNASVLGSHVVNFSACAPKPGLILHTAVTIGYDASWRQVHDLLIAAARSTANILESPAPFVLQTGLNDFNVTYEINAYTDRPNEMIQTYSQLHQNIQDQFNAAGVEIMSPNYTSIRDGNTVTIPPEHRPAGYAAPEFRVNVERKG